MATPRNTLVQTLNPTGSGRSYYRKQTGWYGDHSSVYPYSGCRAFSSGSIQCFTNPPTYMDAANCVPLVDFQGSSGIPSWSRATYNQAYARFRGKVVGSTAELGTTFAEWRESLDLITSSAIKAYNAYKAIRKGKLRKALQELGVSKSNRRRRRRTQGADAASSLYLDYAFGVAPTIQDMYSAMEVLSQPLPYGKKSAGASCTRNWNTTTASNKRVYHSKIRHRVGADILLTNPNAFLMNQLGILNPASIAWELVPFSFMVDWFYNVGNYLNSFSDWAGLELRNPWHSHRCSYTADESIINNPNCKGLQKGFGYASERGAGIPRPIPTLQFNGDLGTSINRAASAVSILIQVLISGTKK